VAIHIGETEWSASGRFTGITDIDLTPRGIAQVTSAAQKLVGYGKLIDPDRLVCVVASPRRRAMTTLKLLLPQFCETGEEKVIITEKITEWNYGRFEGMTKNEIIARKKKEGWNEERQWDVRLDGCEGGE
jgi:broad specificity phosphatase PhoE